MNGTKLVVNNTDAQVNVSYIVREGGNPAHVHGGGGAVIHANSQRPVHYGSEENPFLNSFTATSHRGDRTLSKSVSVDVRSDGNDDEMNMHNTIVITLDQNKLDFHAENR